MIIAVDFDGTCVTHEFPRVGADIGAVPVLKKLVEKGHQIILYTMRSHPDKDIQGKDLKGRDIPNDPLQDAVDWFEKNDIPLLGVNENPYQKQWTSSPKIFADIYIDDAALGCPVIHSLLLSEHPYVDWGRVVNMLVMRGVL